MADQKAQDAPDRSALASAFTGHVSTTRAGNGAKILAAVLAAALAAGLVVGAGYLTRPQKHSGAASAPSGQVTVTAPATAPSGQVTVTAPATAPAPTAAPAIAPAPAPTAVLPAAPSAAPSLPQAQATPEAGGAPGFTAMTGYGCGPTSSAAFTEHGRWSDGLNGFISVPAGGPRGEGCDGSFDAMPMSGSTAYDDPSNYALWTFRTAPVVRGTCDLEVYVPASSSIERVGGNPAVYQVFDSAGTAGPPLGSFNVDQVANGGRWVTEPGWAITGGALTVKLDSFGVDWSGNSPTYAHIAVSAVVATCS